MLPRTKLWQKWGNYFVVVDAEEFIQHVFNVVAPFKGLFFKCSSKSKSFVGYVCLVMVHLQQTLCTVRSFVFTKVFRREGGSMQQISRCKLTAISWYACHEAITVRWHLYGCFLLRTEEKQSSPLYLLCYFQPPLFILTVFLGAVVAFSYIFVYFYSIGV